MATPWLQMKPWFWGNVINSNCSPIWTCHTRSPCLEWNCYGHAVRNWNFQNYKIMISQCINPYPGNPPPPRKTLIKQKEMPKPQKSKTKTLLGLLSANLTHNWCICNPKITIFKKFVLCYIYREWHLIDMDIYSFYILMYIRTCVFKDISKKYMAIMHLHMDINTLYDKSITMGLHPK